MASPCGGLVAGMSAVTKLQCLFALVGRNWRGSVGLLQAWLVATVPTLQNYVLLADPTLVVGNPAFKDFRLKSCGVPLQLSSSMPGRVWCTGAVQIIQNVLIIPPRLHPRTSLSDDDARHVSELVYMPVYDLCAASGHPVAVLEVLFTSSPSQTVLMADFISFVGKSLTQLQMSFTNPCPVAGGGGSGTLVSRRADGVAVVRGRARPAAVPEEEGGCDSRALEGGADQDRVQPARVGVSDSASSSFEGRRCGQQGCGATGGDGAYAMHEACQPCWDGAAAAEGCGGAALRRVRSVVKFGGDVSVLMSHGGGGICAMS